MKILALTAILLLALTACQRPQPVPVVQEVIVTATPDPTYPTVAAHTPDLPATIQALVNRPTVTPIPTATPAPILPSVSTATPQPTATPQVFPTPLPTATPQAYPAFPTPQPTATPQVFPMALPTATPLPYPYRPTPTYTVPQKYAEITLADHVVAIISNGLPIGTGFFIQDPNDPSEWYVITNAHILRFHFLLPDGGYKQVDVQWQDQTIRDVTVLGVDWGGFDLALLDISPGDFNLPNRQFIQFGANLSAGIPPIGTQVIGVAYSGHPEGPSAVGTVHEIVESDNSQYNYHPDCEDIEAPVTWIRSRLFTRPGYSGGPLMTLDGDIIGILSQSDWGNIGRTHGDEGTFAFAIPMQQIFCRFSYLKNGGAKLSPTPETIQPGPSFRVKGESYQPSIREGPWNDRSFVAFLIWPVTGPDENALRSHGWEHGPCLTRVTENDGWYSWQDPTTERPPCHYKGASLGNAVEDGSEVKIDGIVYQAPTIELERDPFAPIPVN